MTLENEIFGVGLGFLMGTIVAIVTMVFYRMIENREAIDLGRGNVKFGGCVLWI
jgi:hypothetical protein